MTNHLLKRVPVAALVLLLTGFGSAAEAQQRSLTLDNIFDQDARVDFDGSVLSVLSWLDNEHYIERRGGADPSDGGLLKVHAVTGEREPLFDMAQLEAAIRELPGVTAEEATELAGHSDHRWNADWTALLFEIANDLYYYEVGTNLVRRLTRTAAEEREVSFSPDGRSVAFVRDQDLYVVNIEFQVEHALATDDNPSIRNGLLDWVYQEEIYGRGDFRGYWWSPDSTRIAYLQLNDATVPVYTVLDHIPYRPEVEHWDYPKAGDSNPLVRLGIVRSVGGDTLWVDIAHYAPNQLLVVDVDWSSDSRDVVFQVQDREQTWLDLNVASVDTGLVTRVLREETEAWVNVNGSPTWLEDGSFFWFSERSGWKHLYHYRRDGTLIRQVTDGKWEMRQLLGLDERGGWLYFSGTERSHIGNDIYRVRLDGSELTRLSVARGTHRAQFSPSFTHYVDTWSDIVTPSQVRLHTIDGAQTRVIDANTVSALGEFRLSKPEFLQLPNRDNFMMEAVMIKPPNFDPARRYPVYQHVYGGPHIQRVRNAWGGRTGMFWQLLAQRGIIVWVLDNSTASGKGAVSTWPVYKNFGELELRDIEDGIGWLTQQPYIDASRIGIEGWSYGGFMVSYALTHSLSFTMGIAGGSVTDWRDYDTIYTERYMLMPQNNPDGYRTSSPRFAAADLHGALLLIHGTMDENVHMQNTLQFANELQKVGKTFEMMIYPRSRHRLGGLDLEKHRHITMLDFVFEHLRPSSGTTAATSVRH